MSEQEVIALVFDFLKKKDQTCAEIYKRAFDPDQTIVENLPPLEEIVEFYLKSKKKVESKKSGKANIVDPKELENMMQIAKTKSSDLLTLIVNKRNQGDVWDSDTQSEEEDEDKVISSDSDEEKVQKEQKRRRTSNGMQKVWKDKEGDEKKAKNKKKKITTKKSSKR